MNPYDDMEPVEGETTYPEYDEEFGCFGVFGLSSGFCYEQHMTYESAAISSNAMNQKVAS